MEMKGNVLLGLILVATFVFLITVLVIVYSLYPNGTHVPSIFAPVVEYHLQLMILMAMTGISSGFVVYGILNAKIEKQEKALKTNLNIILKFLTHDERLIVELMNDNQGQATQSQIGHLPNMTRLRAHRAVKKLEERGIVIVLKEGKLNILKLSDDLYTPSVSK